MFKESPIFPFLIHWVLIAFMLCTGIGISFLTYRHVQSVDALVENLTPEQPITLTLTPQVTQLSFEAYASSRTIAFDTTDARFLLNRYPDQLRPMDQTWQCSLGGTVSQLIFSVQNVSDDQTMLQLSKEVTKDIALRKHFNPDDPTAMTVYVDGYTRLYNLRWASGYKRYCRYFILFLLLPGLLFALGYLCRQPRYAHGLAILSLLGLGYFSIHAYRNFTSNLVYQYALADRPYLIFSSQPTTLPQGNWQPGRNWQIDYDDTEAIRQLFSDQVYFLSPICHTGFMPIQGNAGSRSAQVIGITPDFWQAYPVQQVYGRFFNVHDLVTHSRFCLLGEALCETLFGPNADPCGLLVMQGNQPFEVIGVIRNTNELLNPDTSIDYAMFIPITTGHIYYSHDKTISSLTTLVRQDSRQETVTEQIRQLLYARHTIASNDTGALSVVNLHDQLAPYTRWVHNIHLTLIMTLLVSVLLIIIHSILLFPYKLSQNNQTKI